MRVFVSGVTLHGGSGGGDGDVAMTRAVRRFGTPGLALQRRRCSGVVEGPELEDQEEEKGLE